MTTSLIVMLSVSLSLTHTILQLGHFLFAAIHLFEYIKQNVCEYEVIMGFARNSLQTPQRLLVELPVQCDNYFGVKYDRTK